MANYQITNRTGAQVKTILDKFTSTSTSNNLTLTGAISGGSLSIAEAITGGATLVIGTQKSGTTLGANATILGELGTASGVRSLAIGYNTTASGGQSCSEGNGSIASGTNSHAEGMITTASGVNSHAEGQQSKATIDNAHAEGFNSTASGNYSHAEGGASVASGTGSHAEGSSTTASETGSHAEGSSTTASGTSSHAEGYSTSALGKASHAEGGNYYTDGTSSFADWEPETGVTISGPLASGNNSHAEGLQTYAKGFASHAEGGWTTASGMYSHAGGYGTIASGTDSHAEGNYTTASRLGAHAEGGYTTASGMYSHTEGYYTIASHDYNTTIGKYNTDDRDAPLHIGAGASNSIRWTSFWVNWEGNLNVSHYGLNGSAYNLTPEGNSWIDATHNWTSTTESALNIWNMPSDGGFHSWIRHRTANNYFVMGVIPSNNGFYIATNPAGANTSTNSISKMLNWNGSNGSLSISGSLSQGSDRRLKNIYGDITEEETLAILEGVNIVNYSYKYDDDVENNIRSGIIAQDLQQILEEHNIEKRAYLTTINIPRNEKLIESVENENNEEEPWGEDEMTREFLGISYVDLVPILIKGWQIHKQKMEELKEENRFLMRRLDELEDKINAITSI